MKNIKRHINQVEMMLAVSEKNRQAGAVGRISSGDSALDSFQVESIRAIVDVAKTLNTLLDSMDRLISTEEEE